MKILFIIGTRPEAIKMAPLISKFIKSNKFEVKLCNTGQHKELVSQVFDFFKLKVDYNLNIMTENQVIWGVGRGSSVSSYVLYLIGIHRINSLTYDLSIDEFLK